MLGRLTRRGALRTVIGGLASGLFAASGMRRAEGTGINGSSLMLSEVIKPTKFEYEGCKVCRDGGTERAIHYRVVISGGGAITRNEMRAYAEKE